jgi:hypothetical protein
MKDNFVIPANIPWDRLKGKDLEECLYWLLDEIGGKDLEWRLGGSGGGTADQGRDLEAYFHVPMPDGEVNRQKWWVEAKGRSATVEPAVVKESVHNASGVAEIDVLLIATNTQFSNPTRDWVKQWQKSHPRPNIKLWDRNTLEKLISQYPSVAIRLFAEALSPQGRLEVLRVLFWNHCSFPDESALRVVWKEKKLLEWSEQSLLAVIAGEMANGNIGKRPWSQTVDNEFLVQSLSAGVLNAMYFYSRADKAGINEYPYTRAMAYLTLACLDRFSIDLVWELFDKAWEWGGVSDASKDMKNMVTEVVAQQLKNELADVCTSDCVRVSADPMFIGEKEIHTYWDRLGELKELEEIDETKPTLIIEHNDRPCKVGFYVDSKHRCPFLDKERYSRDAKGKLEMLQQVIRARNPHHDRD